MDGIRPAAKDDENAVFDLARQLSPKFTVDRTAFLRSFPLLLEKEEVYLHATYYKKSLSAPPDPPGGTTRAL